jgi:chemotaxis protein MotB
MMTMFVMFAVMLAYFLSERNVMDAFQSELQTKSGTGGTMGGQTGKTGGEGSEGSEGGEGGEKGVKGNDPTLSEEDRSGEDPGLSPEKLLELTEHAMSETDIEDVEIYLQDDKTVKISLRGPLLFDLGSANLRGETKRFLGKVSFVLSKTRNEVHVVGHTDTTPIHSPLFPTNWELSVSRAAAVARHLIKAAGLEEGRFTVMGNAMYRPVMPNTTIENKQLNRRVEIIITKKIYQEPVL